MDLLNPFIWRIQTLTLEVEMRALALKRLGELFKMLMSDSSYTDRGVLNSSTFFA